MDSTKYIGMDAHKETISIAVMNSAGKLVIESTLETEALTILHFVQGLRGNLQVTFEEGTWAAWLYNLLKPFVTNAAEPWPSRSRSATVMPNPDPVVDSLQISRIAADLQHEARPVAPTAGPPGAGILSEPIARLSGSDT